MNETDQAAINFVNKFANSGLARKLARTKQWADELMAKLKTRNSELEESEKRLIRFSRFATEVVCSNKLLKDEIEALLKRAEIAEQALQMALLASTYPGYQGLDDRLTSEYWLGQARKELEAQS